MTSTLNNTITADWKRFLWFEFFSFSCQQYTGNKYHSTRSTGTHDKIRTAGRRYLVKYLTTARSGGMY